MAQGDEHPPSIPSRPPTHPPQAGPKAHESVTTEILRPGRFSDVLTRFSACSSEGFFYQNALQSEREQDARQGEREEKFGLMAADCPNDTTQQDSCDKLQEHVKRLPVYYA